MLEEQAKGLGAKSAVAVATVMLVMGCGGDDLQTGTLEAAATYESLKDRSYCTPGNLNPGRFWVDESCAATPDVPSAVGAISVQLQMVAGDDEEGSSFRAGQKVKLQLIISNDEERDIVLDGVGLKRLVRSLQVIDPDGRRHWPRLGDYAAGDPGPMTIVWACNAFHQILEVQPIRAG